MSATAATPAQDVASTSPARDWLAIPRLAGALLWRHWPQLLFWFFAQRVAYDAFLFVAIALAEKSVLLSYAAIALLIVGQIACTIMMFLVLRPSMPALASGRTLASASQPWMTSLSLTLLPFFAYYVTWGLLDGVRRDFQLSYRFGVGFDNRENLADVLSLKGLWIALLAAAAIRFFAKRFAQASGKLRWNLLAAACEAYWIFVGVAAIAKAVGIARDTWHGTVAYQAITGWWHNPFVFHLPLDAIKRLVAPLFEFAATAAGAILMPLVWLAITAVIFGLDLRRGQRIDRADAHFSRLGERYQHSHFLVRNVVDRASAGWSSKGVPLVNAIRLVFRAGLPALLTLCLGWELLAFVDAWGWRLAVDAIGPQDQWTWRRIGQPIALLVGSPLSLRPPLFTELLRVVLLAAVFDRAISHLPPPTPPQDEDDAPAAAGGTAAGRATA